MASSKSIFPRLRSAAMVLSFRSNSASLALASSRFDVFRLFLTCLPAILNRAKITPDDTKRKSR